MDTADAGANLILAENSRSTVSGSYVAKIYKDAEGEKKLWKQDGAVYSYMSMNVYGPGALGITCLLYTSCCFSIWIIMLSVDLSMKGISTF